MGDRPHRIPWSEWNPLSIWWWWIWSSGFWTLGPKLSSMDNVLQAGQVNIKLIVAFFFQRGLLLDGGEQPSCHKEHLTAVYKKESHQIISMQILQYPLFSKAICTYWWFGIFWNLKYCTLSCIWHLHWHQNWAKASTDYIHMALGSFSLEPAAQSLETWQAHCQTGVTPSRVPSRLIRWTGNGGKWLRLQPIINDCSNSDNDFWPLWLCDFFFCPWLVANAV